MPAEAFFATPLKGTIVDRKKILIIDDEKLILVTTEILLKGEGMDVVTANSGEEGLALAEKEKPDIVLLDLQMPEMDGWSVLARFKDNDRLSRIPVILFSGDDPLEYGLLAKDRGASAVYQKPFDLPKLLSTIDGLTGKSFLRRPKLSERQYFAVPKAKSA